MPESTLSSFNSHLAPKGQIQIIFGPMFSGKTTELMRRLKRYQVAKHSCLIIKYANDVRYDSSQLATHDHQTLSAVSTTTLTDLAESAAQYSIIGIDEGQFFPDTVEFSERMANEGKTVIVAALDATYQRKGFGNILQLVPLAEQVIKLTAVCMRCYKEASYTKRISQETALEVIGGSDKYIAVCRACYIAESPVKMAVAVASPLKEKNSSVPASSTTRIPKFNLDTKDNRNNSKQKENSSNADTSVPMATES